MMYSFETQPAATGAKNPRVTRLTAARTPPSCIWFRATRDGRPVCHGSRPALRMCTARHTAGVAIPWFKNSCAPADMSAARDDRLDFRSNQGGFEMKVKGRQVFAAVALLAA